jgi:hypothetical protein
MSNSNEERSIVHAHVHLTVFKFQLCFQVGQVLQGSHVFLLAVVHVAQNLYHFMRFHYVKISTGAEHLYSSAALSLS